jgi:hypothetical protein
MNEGNLHKWFKGSKSKDGKSATYTSAAGDQLIGVKGDRKLGFNFIFD